MNTTACFALQAFMMTELSKAQHRQSALLAKDNDPEHVHQLRISLRKLRSALRLCQAVLKPAYRKRWQRRLRDAAKSLDEARDLDVLILAITAQADSDETLKQHLLKQQKNVYRTLRKKLHREQRAHLKKLKKQLKKSAWETKRCRRQTLTLSELATRQLEPIYSTIMQAQAHFDALDESAMHRLRIKCKQLRYGCEFTSPALKSKALAAFLSALRQLQDHLGELHDSSVQQGMLENCPNSVSQGMNTERSNTLRNAVDADLAHFLSLKRPWVSLH